jgi:hypothetical protein
MTQETTGIDAIEKSIYNLLRCILVNEPVLNERSPGPRPQNAPYSTFMLFWLEGHGHLIRDAEYNDDTDTSQQMIADDAYITARVVCYGQDSLKRCSMLRMALMSDMPQIQQMAANIGISDVHDIQAIPEADVNGAIRERAYINFKFYHRVAQEFTIDHFDTLAVTQTIER